MPQAIVDFFNNGGLLIVLMVAMFAIMIIPQRRRDKKVKNMLASLKAGDRVVSEGQFRLKPGSKVHALAPGETPAAPTAEELAKLKAKAGAQGQRGGGGPRH